MPQAMAQWCAALLDAAEQLPDPDPLFEIEDTAPEPADPADAALVVESLRRVATIFQERQVYDSEIWLAGAGRLLGTLSGSASTRRLFQQHEQALCAILEGYAEAEDDPSLRALAWLDTERSLTAVARIIVDQFQAREIVGHGDAVRAIPRTTSHVSVLFPRLLTPFEQQRARSLLWDEWHVDTGREIAALAMELLKTQRLDPSICQVARPEVVDLVNGGGRLSRPLPPKAQAVFAEFLELCSA
jgi:hypothetical protein